MKKWQKNEVMCFLQKALFAEFSDACNAGIISQKWEIYALYERAGACATSRQNKFLANLRARLGQEDFLTLINKGKAIVARESATILELLAVSE